MNRDQYGMIGQIQADGTVEGGDALCFNCNLSFYWRPIDFTFFRVGFGAYVRHPDPENTNEGFGAYYKHPWDGCISRDQATPLIGCLIKYRHKKLFLEYLVHHGAWLFSFMYNTRKNGQQPNKTKWKWPDPTGPDIWAMEIRGLMHFFWPLWILYPLLVIMDLHLLINTLYVNRKEDDDIQAFMIKFLIAQEYFPTPLSYLAAKLLDKQRVYGKIKSYWSGWRQLPEVAGFMFHYLERRHGWPAKD